MRSRWKKLVWRALLSIHVTALPLSFSCGEESQTVGRATNFHVNLSKGYVPVKCQNGVTIREDRLRKNAEVAAISDPYNQHHVIAAWVGGQGIMSSVSADGGRTWSPARPLPLTACINRKLQAFKGGADEWIAVGKDKTVYVSALVSYREVDRQALLVDTSIDGGLTWQDPVVVPIDNKLNGDIDNTTIVADPDISGWAYVATESIHDESTSSIGFTRTTDGGKTWSAIREVTKPSRSLRFPGPQLLFENSSKRLYAYSKVQELGKSWIAQSYSDDRGVSWSDPVRIAECTNVQSGTKLGAASIEFEPAQDMLHVAEDEQSGSIYLVFNDGSATDGRYLGISLVSSPDRGRTWTRPVSIGSPGAGQAFQPAIAVNSKHEIGVSYYDTRSTFPELPGKTLPVTVRLTTVGRRGQTSESLLDQFNYLGLERRGLLDYQALIAVDDRFYAVYTKTNIEPDQAGPTGPEKNTTDIFFSDL